VGVAAADDRGDVAAAEAGLQLPRLGEALERALLPLPVTAVQILFVNLATDGLPALALAVDTAESDLMKRAPRKSSRTILTRSSVSLLLFGGVWSMIANLSLFAWLLASGAPLDEARGMVFILLIIIQLINAYIFRSDHEPVTRGFLSNRWLHLAVLSQILVLGFLLYVPLLQEIFHTVPPTQNEWLVILLCAFSIVPVLELLKWSQRERGKQ
jgi:Ca2+-transporting ATPase